MTTVEFLDLLHGMGVRVRADGANVLCKAPKGVMTAELQAQVTYRKTEILALLGERASDQDSGPVRLGPMPRLGELPLSFAQQRLWFLDQLDPGTAAYTIAARRRLPRSLDLRALSETLTELVRRHESLRQQHGSDTDAGSFKKTATGLIFHCA